LTADAKSSDKGYTVWSKITVHRVDLGAEVLHWALLAAVCLRAKSPCCACGRLPAGRAVAKPPVYVASRDGEPHMFQRHAEIHSISPQTGRAERTPSVMNLFQPPSVCKSVSALLHTFLYTGCIPMCILPGIPQWHL